MNISSIPRSPLSVSAAGICDAIQAFKKQLCGWSLIVANQNRRFQESAAEGAASALADTEQLHLVREQPDGREENRPPPYFDGGAWWCGTTEIEAHII